MSAGIVGERISGGDVRIALLTNGIITLVSLLVLEVTTRQMRPASALVQAAGAVVGIALVHLVVRERILSDVPWLSERPAQLVNDAAATGAALILIWACARNLDVRVLAGALLVVTIYRVTGSSWHLDHAPHGFEISVQQLVVFQFAASALGLLAFSLVRARLWKAGR